MDSATSAAEMSRMFRRGELRSALLQVLADEGSANGYTIMQRLESRVGARWKASPGSIYPALLALEDDGQITGRSLDGSRTYTLTTAGRAAVDAGLLNQIARRAATQGRTATLGAVVDAFAAKVPKRSAPLSPDVERAVHATLQSASDRILSILDQGAPP